MFREGKLLFLAVLLGAALISPQAFAQPVLPQQVEPINNFTPSKDFQNETFVLPSITNEISGDARINVPDSDLLYFLGFPIIDQATQAPLAFQPFVQRLKGNTYAVMYNAFGSLVYQGNNNLLMVDCGGHFGAGERGRMLLGLAQLGSWDGPPFPAELTGSVPGTENPNPPVPTPGTGLSLHTLVITHPHTDHCGNSVFLKEFFPDLRIVGSKWYDDEVRINNLPMARATRTIFRRFGSFFFEGKKFTFNTPVRSAHTTADSYVITPDKVLMAVDIVQAGRVPFIEVSVARDMLGYIQFLRFMAGEFAAGNAELGFWGHFNIGYERDVQLTLDYMKDMTDTWAAIILTNLDPANFANFLADPNIFSPLNNNIATFLNKVFDDTAEGMFFATEGKVSSTKVNPVSYGESRFYELARDHADRIHETQFLSYLNSFEIDQAFAQGGFPLALQTLSQRIPDFDPIAPGTRLYSE